MEKEKESRIEGKKGKQNDKRVKIFAIAVLILFMIVFLFVLNAEKFLYLQKYEVPIIARVGNTTAFNISKGDTSLNMGTVKYHADMERQLEITNTYPFPVKFEYIVEGDIESILIYPIASYLRPNESLSVPIKTNIAEDTEYGEYIGIIKVKVKRFTGKFAENNATNQSNEIV